jgi:energy-converting hydrogenase B subunit D
VNALRVVLLLGAAATAAGTVATRDPVNQSMAVSLHGLVLAVLFFVYQAPDVALSQLVVGAVALPLMILLALSKVRKDEAERRAASARGRGGDARPGASGGEGR